MSSFVRASKYRHVYCDPPKPEGTYSGLRLATATGEQCYIKANSKFFAVSVQGGGGPLLVMPVDAPQRVNPTQPLISGHTSAVLDTEFNPFHDHVLCSASDDSTIKVWGIPEGGVTETIREPLVDLRGHRKKVTLIRAHPTAANVLGSVSGDYTAKIWDIEKGAEMASVDDVHGSDLIQDIVWDFRGDMMATSCKDKNVRVIDPRTGTVTAQVKAHEGAKSCKLTFLGTMDKLLSVGFTRQSQRQFKIWDPRNFTKEVKKVDIDQASGVMMPFYDIDCNLLYLAGKGDGNIRYYEFVDSNPYCFYISEFRTTTAQKGVARVPKRGLDVLKCETVRFMKLTSNSVEPLSFIVPRKSDAFQEDLFPPTASAVPAHSAEEWLAGSSKEPNTISLDPAGAAGAGAGGGGGGATASSAGASGFSIPRKTAVELQRELDGANAYIEVLVKEMERAGVAVPPREG